MNFIAGKSDEKLNLGNTRQIFDHNLAFPVHVSKFQEKVLNTWIKCASFVYSVLVEWKRLGLKELQCMYPVSHSKIGSDMW